MRLLRLIIVLPLTLAVSGCLVAPPILIAADVVSAAMKAGVDYAEKNKPTSKQLWEEARVDRLQRRAQSGDVEAQYELGLVHQAAQSGGARHWVCRAANSGLARAQAHMGHWYNEDRKREDLWPFIDIRPDNKKAFVWYSLAESNGDVMSLNYRNRIMNNAMTTGDLDEARVRLTEWAPEQCGGFTAVAGGRPAEAAAR